MVHKEKVTHLLIQKKSNLSHSGPALNAATLDMMRKDEEEKKRKEENNNEKKKEDTYILNNKHRKKKKKHKKQNKLKRIHFPKGSFN